MTVVVRVNGAPEATLRVARDAIQKLDPLVPVYDSMTMDELAGALSTRRVFGAGALRELLSER